MPVSEERLTAVVTRTRRKPPRAYDHNPVAGLIVESMALGDRQHEHAIREAGAFLLDLLRADDPGTTRLALPVAMRVLARDEARAVDEVCCYLAQTARRDVLLGIAVHALVGRSSSGPRWEQHADGRREAVMRTLFLLLRMFEAQEQVDDLHHHFGIE